MYKVLSREVAIRVRLARCQRLGGQKVKQGLESGAIHEPALRMRLELRREELERLDTSQRTLYHTSMNATPYLSVQYVLWDLFSLPIKNDQPCAPLESEIRPRPLNDHEDSVSESN